MKNSSPSDLHCFGRSVQHIIAHVWLVAQYVPLEQSFAGVMLLLQRLIEHDRHTETISMFPLIVTADS